MCVTFSGADLAAFIIAMPFYSGRKKVQRISNYIHKAEQRIIKKYVFLLPFGIAQTFTNLLCITSPNARLPERNAIVAIPALSARTCPSVPLTQYLKNRISKMISDV